jgi:hypothetical protein
MCLAPRSFDVSLAGGRIFRRRIPAVEHWLAAEMGLPARQMQTLELHWAELSTVGDPPLTPHVFLANREAAGEKLKEVFSGTTLQLKLDTRFPDQIADFVAAYEGWYALGPRLFDEHLDRMKNTAVSVLCERAPKFELSPEERYAASIHGKALRRSHVLRKGLAESLALVGNHPKALTSCSFGKADATAVLAVREILAQADWVQWASLNDLLPLLAEAAPREFLKAVENTLNSDPCPFDTVFAQESSGVMGSNYMTGLLWAHVAHGFRCAEFVHDGRGQAGPRERDHAGDRPRELRLP